MKSRRILALVLIVLGMGLLIAAPGTTDAPADGGGLALIVLGVLIELIGIYLERRR